MLEPLLTLHEIFGSKYIVNGRASYHNSQWLPGQISQDSTSGSLLAVAGKVPIICHEDVSRASCLMLLEAAGLQVGSNLLTYEDEESYYELLQYQQSKGSNLVFNYAHLPGEFDEKQYWIDKELLLFLNNKSNLEELVSQPYVPKRRILPIDHLVESDTMPFDFPYVVKAATDEPNGGGLEVVICKTLEDLQRARELFRFCSFVVVEEFLKVKRNFCVQFAHTYTGDTVYLGSAEQVITEEGKYLGNWIDMHDQPPEEAIELCRQVMEKAASLGYVGFAGIDIVFTEDNRMFIIDLNFRQNGSTMALLFKDSIAELLDATVLKLGKWKINSTFHAFRLLTETLIRENMMIPFCIYNPTNQTDDNPIFVYGVLLGRSKEEIMEVERQIHEMGFR
ncbi:ATP-grasp domain-containing protein [Paenibacillus sp. NPDC056579]|uniref:ATP-grasp domain-containing protein n=1 Tax=unclassified Paenibacillus TaxID=185978 RepID=UPI001EF92FBE|nr:ATP-grasp domain-containing protein [Paenibacillus sp. H1-7]ULL14505.1 ATP-grasp domain-containing protein [Paenibacillus sp. H1-7]